MDGAYAQPRQWRPQGQEASAVDFAAFYIYEAGRSGVGVAICGQIFFAIIATEMAAGSAQHPSFVAGMQNALIFEAAAFLAAAVRGPRVLAGVRRRLPFYCRAG